MKMMQKKQSLKFECIPVKFYLTMTFRNLQYQQQSKASGFDNIILSCAILTDSAMITDDLKLHEIAQEHGYESYLLRDLI